MKKPVTLVLAVKNKTRAAYWRAAILAAIAAKGKLVFSHRERANVYNAARSMQYHIGTQMTVDGEAVELVLVKKFGSVKGWKRLGS